MCVCVDCSQLQQILSGATSCRYLGVSADAELEEIKAAYRRLSKEYHPDSTSLPLEVAAEKFLRLKVSFVLPSIHKVQDIKSSR
jgi:hypothetical protein